MLMRYAHRNFVKLKKRLVHLEIMNKKVHIILLAWFLMLSTLPSPQKSAVINNTTVIDSPGYYVLTDDINC